jgi:hypothetical protein
VVARIIPGVIIPPMPFIIGMQLDAIAVHIKPA